MTAVLPRSIRLMILGAATTALLASEPALAGEAKAVSALVFAPDGHAIAVGSEDSTMTLWDVSDGTLLRTYTGHTDAVRALAFSPNGTTIATASKDGSLKLWDAATGQTTQTIDHAFYSAKSVGFPPDASALPEARECASGAKATAITVPAWPCSVAVARPVATSQILTVLSAGCAP